MKIIVFSDTHGDELSLNQMLEYEKSWDDIYCLGDSGFSKAYLTSKEIKSVKGNYPFSPNHPYHIRTRIASWLFLFTHGHLYGVKMGLSKLLRQANKDGVQVCGFGHTHRLYLKKKGQVIFFNPGALSVSRSFPFPSYARITLDKEKIQIDLINHQDKTIIRRIQEARYDK